MKHLLIFILCILSIEFIYKFNYINLINSVLKIIRKTLIIIFNKRISDHWKEIIVPLYSLKILQKSFNIFMLISTIGLFFLLVDKFLFSFIYFLISPIGIFETLLISIIYFSFRRIILK